MAVLEHQFRDHVQVLDPEWQLKEHTHGSLESETPARGLAANKHVYAGAGVHTEQDGTRETFFTLPVDFGFLSFFPSHRLAM